MAKNAKQDTEHQIERAVFIAEFLIDTFDFSDEVIETIYAQIGE